MDPVTFLRDQAPFDRLSARELAPLERCLEVVYLPAGTRVLVRGGPPAAHLFLVRSGAVRLEREDGLVLLVEEGELFGYRSVLAGEPPTLDAVAETDVICYRFPAAVARPVLGHSAVAASMARGLAERLRGGSPPGSGPEPGLVTPLRELVTREPITVEPGTPVAEAARMMRAAGVSSVLVASRAMRPGTGPGAILTDRDLRNRVVAEGRPPETPVDAVASRPVLTLSAGTPLLEAVLFMLERNVHHVPITDGGTVVGMVTDTDVLRRQARTPLYLLRSLERAQDRGGLGGYGAELAGVVRNLAGTGVEATSIGRVVSALNDTLIRTLVRLAESRLGPAPAPWAWLALGSGGRLEQTMLTDQDNALVFAPSPGAQGEERQRAAEWFGRLAEQVVEGLQQAGFPACPGGYMATGWHLPLDEFRDRYRRWMAAHEPEALLEASTFFDFRKVAGALDVEPLERVVGEAAGMDLFLARLAASAARLRPPVGHFHRIVAKDGTVDLKRGAVVPIVALARVYALAAGSRARPTLERLEAAVQAGVLSREGGEDLSEAFRFVMSLRLRAQLKELDGGRPLDNDVDLGALGSLERHHLKDALVAIRDALEGLAFTYQVERLG